MVSVMTDAKTCTKCGEEKPVEEFFWRSKASGKRRSACKVCWTADKHQRRLNNYDQYLASEARYRDENREKVNASNRAWRTRNHAELLIRDAEYRRRNRAAIRERTRVWRDEHREELREYFAKYRLENPDVISRAASKRRAAELGVVSDGSTRSDVWVKSQGHCHLCLAAWPLDSEWHVDHIRPLQPAEGEPGTDTLDNKAVACPPCNIRKGNRLVPSGAYA